jgi:dolichol kinase
LGEISFALSVGLLTFITKNDFIYAVSLLQMGLADGLAAVVGVRYGKNNTYKILGHKKSAAGTFTFFICSLAIIFIGSSLANIHLIWYIALGASTLATVIENIAVWGLDNLLLPLAVSLLLIHS